MKLRWTIFLACVLIPIRVFAGPRVELFEPEFSGTGCPKDSAQVVLVPGAKRIEISFEKFSVQADNALGYVTATKTCNASVRIRVPHGYSVAVESVQYNAKKNLPYGSNAKIIGRHYFNHEPLLSFNKRYFGLTNNSFDIESRISHQQLFWSPCGEDALLSSHTNIYVSSKKSLDPASVIVNDEQPGIVYNLLWRSCNEQRMP